MERLVLPTLEDAAGAPPGGTYEVAFNPEFLRESTALRDYFAPPKIVVGERARGATQRLRGIYDGIDAPWFEVPFRVAESVKLIDNGFHALKVAFANEIGRICLGTGVDPQAVMDIFLADTKLNLSPAYLRPGGAYGGSCLPKDLGALIALAAEAGVAAPLLDGVRRSNTAHLAHLAAMVRHRLAPPGPVLLIGLSFKPGTDDLRNSPLVELAESLAGAGYALLIHDPDVEPRQLVGANLARAAEHRGNVLEHLTADLAAAAGAARLAVLGKALPGVRERLPAGLPVLDLTRLRLAEG
jgi:GDP-mannose 6-dehydrogenase